MARDAAPLLVRRLGRRAYEPALGEMRRFTDARAADASDELWLLEHPPVYTLGQAGRPEHLLAPGDVPVVASDRGGQVTYHGPGQMIAYTLIDLRRARLGVRDLVALLEETVIRLLAGEGVRAARRAGAPGVFVDGCKVAALGLRIRNRCSYHGMSVNVAMDLEPFSRIDPCGFPGLEVAQLADLGIGWSVEETAGRWARLFAALAGYRPSGLEDGPRR